MKDLPFFPAWRYLALSALVLTLFAFAMPAEKTAHYTIEGPFCSGCVGLLEKTARAVEGVSGIEVDVEARAVRVLFDDEQTTPEAIRDHINEETTFRLALKEVTPPGIEPGGRR